MEIKILLLLIYSDHKYRDNYHTDGKDNKYIKLNYQYYIYRFHYVESELRESETCPQNKIRITLTLDKGVQIFLSKVWFSGRKCKKSQ